jgi:16S rRNA (adenine1518-N6/adenine1519-N6)-dimethyltransferase
VIGNFPYNISTQIVFKVLENRERITEVVGMFQKEVADRLCAGPGSRTYGITSVLAQVWYHMEPLFLVEPDAFIPPAQSAQRGDPHAAQRTCGTTLR